MSHQCICDKTTTTLCVQTVGTCQTCQELSAKMCNLNMYDTFFGEYKRFFGAFGSKCNHICYCL